MTNDDVKMLPLMESPVIQRVGVTEEAENGARDDAQGVLTMKEWRQGRTKLYGRTKTVREVEGGLDVETEIIAGLKVRHYN